LKHVIDTLRQGVLGKGFQMLDNVYQLSKRVRVGENALIYHVTKVTKQGNETVEDLGVDRGTVGTKKLELTLLVWVVHDVTNEETNINEL
jgi:hypothetical protein